MPRKAVVLLSGGLDSTTVLAIARELGFECYALSFNYGQRHFHELLAATNVAHMLGVTKHVMVDVQMPWSKSALTRATDVPKGRTHDEIGRGIPVTYVPARNMIFLSHAVSWAESIGSTDVFAGMNALDYSGYPDCRPEFVEAFQLTARLGTQSGVEGGAITVHTPLIRMSKGQIIREGVRMGVNYGATLSCYDPSHGRPCRACDSCQIRAKGFLEAGIVDPGVS